MWKYREPPAPGPGHLHDGRLVAQTLVSAASTLAFRCSSGSLGLARVPALHRSEMLLQERERPLAVDGMSSVEVFDLGLVGHAELRIEPSHFRILVRNPFIATYPVVVAALDHKGPRQ